jgi:hypothetical protein
MNWEQALDRLIAHTGHERYRLLTAAVHPDCELWRQRVLALAGDLGDPPPAHPIPLPALPAAPGPCGGCPGSPLALDDPELEIDHPQGL